MIKHDIINKVKDKKNKYIINKVEDKEREIWNNFRTTQHALPVEEINFWDTKPESM